MDSTPTLSRFDDAYKAGAAPWVIGEPQPAIVDLRTAGRIHSKVLDVGCGTGEHTILLTRLGYDVLGVDYAPTAVEQARANAADKGVDARFEVADAMNLGDDPVYDTIVDSALFHIFDDADRPRYVRSLHAACRPGGLVHVLALSDGAADSGRRSARPTIRDAFGDGWAAGGARRDHLPRRRAGTARRGPRPAGGHGGRRARVAGARASPLSGLWRSSSVTAARRKSLRVGVAGVRDGEAVADERAQAGQHVARPVVEVTGADGRRQLRLVGEAERGQRVGDLAGGLVEQFALDDAQHIGGDAGVEVDLACVGEATIGPVAPRTSLSRKSATAATSSAAVGRP